MRAIRVLTLFLALALVACAGDGDAGTTVAGEVTTTEAGDPTTTPADLTTTTAADEEDGGTASLDDMPAECVDALAGYLRAIEPVVENADFEAATADDLEALGTEIEAVSEEFSTQIEELDCPDLEEADDEQALAAVIALAEREAPGTVGYLEWIQSFASVADSFEASGDCETDIAALQAIIDENPSMADLPMGQVVEVGGLVASISTVCPPERAEEFLSQAAVTNFLDG